MLTHQQYMVCGVFWWFNQCQLVSYILSSLPSDQDVSLLHAIGQYYSFVSHCLLYTSAHQPQCAASITQVESARVATPLHMWLS
jgi:hypothetical protein